MKKPGSNPQPTKAMINNPTTNKKTFIKIIYLNG